MKLRLIIALLSIPALVDLALADKGVDREALIAKIKDVVEPMTIPGGKSLQDMFGMWFAKVDRLGVDGLSLQLMRGGTQYVNIYKDEHSWESVGAGNTVSVRSGERKCIWIEGLSLVIGLDNAMFPAEGCAWLTNSTHTVFVRMRESRELRYNNTDKEDAYVISLDLKKAYYIEGKKDVDYPFPFVNARPDVSQEEWELQKALPGYLDYIDEKVEEFQDLCNPVVPNVRRVIKSTGKVAGRDKMTYIVFESDGRSLFCVEFYRAADEGKASATLSSFDYKGKRFRVAELKGDGATEFCHVIEDDALKCNRDSAFMRLFVREVLARLNLTAADLPGINLEPILGAGR